jgi:hypothetical protein
MPANHKITISVLPGGGLDYIQDTDAHPSRPGKRAHVKHNETIQWTCSDGNFAGLFKQDSPLDIAGFAGQSGDTTKKAKVTAVFDPSGGNAYRYFVVIVKDDGTVLTQDPVIIIDT